MFMFFYQKKSQYPRFSHISPIDNFPKFFTNLKKLIIDFGDRFLNIKSNISDHSYVYVTLWWKKIGRLLGIIGPIKIFAAFNTKSCVSIYVQQNENNKK